MSLLDASLPVSLRTRTIGDYFEVTKRPKGSILPSVVPFIPMEAIPQGGAYEASYIEKPAEAISSGTYFERGDILVAKITPSFENGKQALVNKLSAKVGYATTEVIPLRPRVAGQDRRLLFFYLLHPDVRSHVAEKMEGATGRQRVPESVLLELPYPDLDHWKQKAIADCLELIQKAIQQEEKLHSKSQVLKRAAMRELFTRGLRGEPQKETEIGLVPESWEIKPIRDVAESASGGTPPKHTVSFWIGDVPWASGKDLKRNRLIDTTDHITREAAENFSKIAPKNSVLILVRGMGLAKNFALSLIETPMAFNQDLKALIPKSFISGAFLMNVLSANDQRMRQKTSTAAHGTKRLSRDDIDFFPIPLPSLAEQAEIVEILDAIDRKIDLHKRKKALLEELFKSLLHKLMTGEIRVEDLDAAALEGAE